MARLGQVHLAIYRLVTLSDALQSPISLCQELVLKDLHEEPTNAMAISPDGSYLASGGQHIIYRMPISAHR